MQLAHLICVTCILFIGPLAQAQSNKRHLPASHFQNQWPRYTHQKNNHQHNSESYIKNSELFFSKFKSGDLNYHLVVANSSDEEAVFYLKIPSLSSVTFNEEGLSLAPQEELKIPIHTPSTWFKVQALNPGLHFKLIASANQLEINIPHYDHLSRKLSIELSLAEYEFGALNLANTSPLYAESKIYLEYENGSTLTLNSRFAPFEGKQLLAPTHFSLIGLQKIIIESNQQVMSFLGAVGNKNYVTFEAQTQKSELSPPDNSKSYYLMSGPGGSFVTHLQDPELIQEAEAQLKGERAKRILIAEINEDAGSQNRNFNSPTATPWSWHVSRALAWSDVGMLECDGTANVVEENLMIWLKSPKRICFWSYKIERKLSTEEIKTGVLKE